MIKLIKCLFTLTFLFLYAEVEVRGLKSISFDDIAGYISPEESEEKIRESLKLLAKTGWFDEISYYKDTKTGKIVLVLTEKELVKDLAVIGLKDKEKLIEELSEFRLKPVSLELRDKILETVKRFLDQKGYLNPKIDMTWSQESRVYTINITKGKRTKTKQISINGVSASLRKSIQEILTLKEYSWWSTWITGEGYFSRIKLSEDLEKINRFLQQKGYIDSAVSIKEEVKDGLALLEFNIDLGERYSFGSINLDEEYGIKPGDKFDGLKLRKALEKVTNEYKDQGYAFVNVFPNMKVDKEKKSIDLAIEVQKGEIQRINEIKIQGNVKTRDRVIRRDFRVVEGEIFNGSKLERSRVRLMRTGLFSDVKYEVFKTPNKNNFVDVNFVVKETQTGGLSVGAGYSTLDNFFGSLRLSEANVFGTGLKFLFTGYLGREFNSFNFRFTEPRIFDSFYQASIDAFRNRRDFDDFKRYQTGGRLSFGYDFEEFEKFKDLSFKVFGDLREIKIDDIEDGAANFIKESKGSGLDFSTGIEIKRMGIDKLIRPSTGSVQSLNIDYSGFFSDFKYYTLGLSNQFYLPVFEFEDGEKIVFTNRTSFDFGRGLKNRKYPLHKRFFPGGSKTNRGYKPRSMGPKEGDSEYGGAKQLINNTEIIVPLVEDIGLDLIMFFDIGEAFDDNQSIQFSDLRKAYGGGIRWNSPAGPIGLDFGFPLDKRKGDSSFVVNFSIGTDF